jgi:inner membrane protein
VKWISHIAIAAVVCVVFNPAAVPAAVLGSTAPDWFEWVLCAVQRGRRVKHRGVTHYLVAWLATATAAHFVWDWNGWLFWFAMGGAIHWCCDALTVSGAPLGWWSDRRMTLFGGKVQTGRPSEYIVTIFIVAICAVVVWVTRSHDSGGPFVPFFYDWPGFYRSGLVSGHEWRANRFTLF